MWFKRGNKDKVVQRLEDIIHYEPSSVTVDGRGELVTPDHAPTYEAPKLYVVAADVEHASIEQLIDQLRNGS